MKNKIYLSFVVVFAMLIGTFSLSGCETKEHFTKVQEIEEGSRIFEVNYENVDYDAGDKFWKDNNDNWDDGGCTAVTKEISNGHRIVGRNMDLNISNKDAYVFRTNVEGFHKTINLAYTFRDYSPDYEDVKKSGVLIISENPYGLMQRLLWLKEKGGAWLGSEVSYDS